VIFPNPLTNATAKGTGAALWQSSLPVMGSRMDGGRKTKEFKELPNVEKGRGHTSALN